MLCSIRGPFVTEAAIKSYFLVARPLRPYPSPPLELSGHIFGKFVQSFKTSNFFLVARPLPPSALSGRATNKELFLRLPQEGLKRASYKGCPNAFKSIVATTRKHFIAVVVINNLSNHRLSLPSTNANSCLQTCAAVNENLP